MSHRVCPYWLGYLLINPIRRWRQNPDAILAPYIKAGMTAVDFGCAMGFFTLPMARMVGSAGRVIAVDIQPRMLQAMQRRAAKAKVADRITAHQCESARLGLDKLAGTVDFITAFFVMHETPDAPRTLKELAALLKPGCGLLIAEPKGHVPEEEYQQTLNAAEQAGLRISDRPYIPGSRAAFLVKGD